MPSILATPEFAQLQQTYESGELSLFVGSTLPRAAGLPSWHGLADELLSCARACEVRPRRIAEIEELIEHGRIVDALGQIEAVLTPGKFARQVARVLDDSAIEELPAIYEAVAALAPRLSAVLTTNLDRLLERAMLGQEIVRLLTEQQWRRPNSERLCGRRLLFVSWGVQDPGFDAILERLAAQANDRAPRHFMLIDRMSLTHVRRKQLERSGLTVIPYENPDGTHGQLLRLLDLLASRAGLACRPRERLSILFAASTCGPMTRLRLQQELQSIREAIDASAQGEWITLDAVPVTTIDDLRRALLRRPYKIVHVRGHADRDGLVLQDHTGRRDKLAPDALAELFVNKAHPRGSIECVVFNAVHALANAMPASELVPMTVALDGRLGDAAVFEFARGFYAAVADGRSMDEAFEAGMRGRWPVSRVSFEARLLRRDKPSLRRAHF